MWCQRADLRKLRLSYIREDRILPHLPALHLQLTDLTTPQRRRRTRRGIDTRHHADPRDVISYLRGRQIILTNRDSIEEFCGPDPYPPATEYDLGVHAL